MAALFGLLHGLGFAGALSEVGLPSSAIPPALLTFNLGVEAGQAAFIGAALLLWAAVSHLRIQLPENTWAVPVYAIGAVAAYWTIDRTLGVLGL